jgi:hypothetical protein
MWNRVADEAKTLAIKKKKQSFNAVAAPSIKNCLSLKNERKNLM